MLEIIPLPALKDNYIWLLKNKISRHVAIIDPSETKPVLDKIKSESLIPIAILITHHHWDHVGGILGIIKQYDIPVYTPKTESVTGSTDLVSEGDIVALPELNINLEILDVPGHTSGAIAYYTNSIVFSGDTLFAGGCGRIFEGTSSQMYASLTKFKTLPANTLLYCGHEYTVKNLKFAASIEPQNTFIHKRLEHAQRSRKSNRPTVPTTLLEESRSNPFLRCEEPNVISAASDFFGKNLNNAVDVFTAIRQWKDNF